MPFPDLPERVREVRGRIDAAVQRGGQGQQVKVVAVTKTHGPDAAAATDERAAGAWGDGHGPAGCRRPDAPNGVRRRTTRASDVARCGARRARAVHGYVQRFRDRGGGGCHARPPRNHPLRSTIRMKDEMFRLTPVDVRRMEFPKAVRGYDKGRVDDFLEQVAGELDRLTRQNQDLDTKMKAHTPSTQRSGALFRG